MFSETCSDCLSTISWIRSFFSVWAKQCHSEFLARAENVIIWEKRYSCTQVIRFLWPLGKSGTFVIQWVLFAAYHVNSPDARTVFSESWKPSTSYVPPFVKFSGRVVELVMVDTFCWDTTNFLCDETHVFVAQDCLVLKGRDSSFSSALVWLTSRPGNLFQLCWSESLGIWPSLHPTSPLQSFCAVEKWLQQASMQR